VLLAAVLLAAVVLLLATVVPARLARAEWPLRAPVLALVLWQALGLAGGLLALEVAFTTALAPLGATHLQALRRLATLPLAQLPAWAGVAAVIGVALLLRLTGVLVSSTARTLRSRHRHRILVDLLAVPSASLPGARVVDHEVPVAYCLPGLRPRLVLSQGVLAVLDDAEVAAVLAHERAHLTQRHDLVVLPFVALGATFPRLPAVRTARSCVALLIELLADDQAVRSSRREVLARALCKVGTAGVPAGGLGAGEDAVLRAHRLLSPAAPLPTAARLAVAAAAMAVLAIPVLGVLLPGV